MPKGGARSRSGRPPQADALNRERTDGDWTVLPLAGRSGPPPRWPLDGGMTTRERQLWRKLWTLPQAVMWERQHQSFEVATYIRRFTEAEKPGAIVAVCTLVRQMSDSLGLTTPGLRSNRWRIDEPVSADAAVISTSPSARDRLKVVGDDGD